jgi:hypothetical protein
MDQIVIIDGDPIVVENAGELRDEEVLLLKWAAQNAILNNACFLITLKAALDFPGKTAARAITPDQPHDHFTRHSQGPHPDC